ncbi:putative pantetheine-phosphate adenylyltransferase CYBJADRAFT_140471, partial [Cyberlindnera jadinii NRRL Y-1542]
MLLTAAAFVTKTKLIIGVTDHELLKNKKYPELLQSYDERVKVITKFVRRIKPNLNVDPVPIRDVCGPTGTIADIDSLIVSRETIKGAEFINKTRLERGFSELKVHIINVIGGEEDDGFVNKLSSTQLRK